MKRVSWKDYLSKVALAVCALALTQAIAPIVAAADTLYKCADATGKLQYQSSACEGTKEVSKKALNTTPVDSGTNDPKASVTVYAGPNGSYYTMAIFNGYPARVMVDTGAYSVAIPATIADKIGLKCEGTIVTATGNGSAQGCKTVVDSLKLGNITLTYVDAIILPNLNTGILLGQSALKRLKVEQANDQITLGVIAGKSK